jgi:uncharacterized protein (UPF0548 family)
MVRLGSRALTYDQVGATAVCEAVWGETHPAFRRYEQSALVTAPWEDARSLMFRWAVKSRSGFAVSAPDGGADPTVIEGASYWLRFGRRPLEVNEPVRVIGVVDEPLRCGFAYGTLDGHPVSGEEAFVLERVAEEGPVQLTIRSLTRPAADGVWRYVFPMLLAAQRVFRNRYLRSLNETGADLSGAP